MFGEAFSAERERARERSVLGFKRRRRESRRKKRKQGLAQAFEPFFKVIFQSKFGVEVSMFLDSIFLRFRLQRAWYYKLLHVLR